MKCRLLTNIQWNTDNPALAKSLPNTILVLDIDFYSDDAVDLLVCRHIGLMPLVSDWYDPDDEWREKDRLDNVVVIHA